jgi:hypothetical protein
MDTGVAMDVAEALIGVRGQAAGDGRNTRERTRRIAEGRGGRGLIGHAADPGAMRGGTAQTRPTLWRARCATEAGVEGMLPATPKPRARREAAEGALAAARQSHHESPRGPPTQSRAATEPGDTRSPRRAADHVVPRPRQELELARARPRARLEPRARLARGQECGSSNAPRMARTRATMVHLGCNWFGFGHGLLDFDMRLLSVCLFFSPSSGYRLCFADTTG